MATKRKEATDVSRPGSGAFMKSKQTSPPPRPVCAPPVVENIPLELRERAQWVCWRYQRNKDRTDWTKVPIDANTLAGASSTDEHTWTSLQTAMSKCSLDLGYDGAGFMFSPNDPYCGIDLDDCIGADGLISPEAQAIIDAFGSYTEISPSGTGVKIFIKGAMPGGGGRQFSTIDGRPLEGMSKIECYSQARFFTVTGRALPGSPTEVRDGQEALDRLVARCNAKPEPPKGRASGKWEPAAGSKRDDRSAGTWRASSLSDDALIERARDAKNGDKFSRLWAGDTSEYGGDESRADLAFCDMLAFWTGKDADQMDRIFRKSGLMREKWDENRGARTYGQMTIEKAIEGCKETFGSCPGGSADDAGVPEGNENLPQIVLGTDEHRVVEEAIAALTSDPGVFKRGGMLVRVMRDAQPDDGFKREQRSPVISRLPTASLRLSLTKAARIVKHSGERLVAAHPSPWLVSGVEHHGVWPGIRALRAVSEAPFVRPDGTVCQQRGYDAATGVLYEPSIDFPPVPESPGRDECVNAIRQLEEIFGDFPLELPEHMSAAIAALLTPLVRHAFSGPAPLFLIDANVPGAGKGLISSAIGGVVTGLPMPVSSYSHESDEMRKKVTSIAIAGDPLVLLDNLIGPFGNDTLDRLLTADTWKDRLLGTNDQIELPLTTVWYATGNNVQIQADTIRRVIHIRITVMEERPEERSEFKHSDLLAWIADNRGRLLVAALTAVRGYYVAGRPQQGLKPMGSFLGWSSLVRELLVWLGLPDPCDTRHALREQADTSGDALEQLMAAWEAYEPNGESHTASGLIAALYPDESPPQDYASGKMREAIENFTSVAGGRKPGSRQLGNRLKSVRKRVINGRYFDQDTSEGRRDGVHWRLVTSMRGPSSGPVRTEIPI